MINNVRISARQKKSELENTNIEIYPQQFDTSFIATYKDTSNNIPTENFLLSYYLINFHICCNGMLIENV